MEDREEIENLLEAVRTGVGLDVYAFDEAGETKHLLPDAVITSIITALVVEFLKGLLRPKETGEAGGKLFRQIVSRVRGEAKSDFAALELCLREYLQETKGLPREARIGHIPKFATELVDAGVPVQTATAIADVVGKEVARLGR